MDGAAAAAAGSMYRCDALDEERRWFYVLVRLGSNVGYRSAEKDFFDFVHFSVFYQSIST